VRLSHTPPPREKAVEVIVAGLECDERKKGFPAQILSVVIVSSFAINKRKRKVRWADGYRRLRHGKKAEETHKWELDGVKRRGSRPLC
jgi:hypothetical protein